MKHSISEKKQERVKQRVVKAARRKKIDPSDTDRLKHVKVQLMSPLLRALLAVIGIALCVFPFLGLIAVWWVFLLAPIGMVLLFIAISGKKKEVGEICSEAGEEFAAEFLSDIIGEIFSGL